MFIHSFALGPLGTNCYVLSEGDEAAAIDPGMRPQEVLDYLAAKSLRLTSILLTHLHWDHVHGCAALVREYESEVHASMKDAFLQEEGVARFPVEGFDFTPLTPGRMELLGSPMLVLDTPGHTPGGLSYYLPRQGWLFTGDTLFHRNVGRTDLPRGSGPELLHSIKQRIFILPDEVEVYPGHGPMTTVGEEKRYNPFFRQPAE